MTNLLLISKDLDFKELAYNYYKNTETQLYFTSSIDSLEEIVRTKNINIVLCDVKFGSISVVQIKKIIDRIKPNVIVTSLGECFGDNDLDSFIDAGIAEFICKRADLRLTDRRLQSLLGHKVSISNNNTNDEVLVSEKENIQINLTQNTLYHNGKAVHVTQLEFDLLVYFLQNKNTLLKRSDIIEKIWNQPSEEINAINSRKVDSFVKKVRHKLDNLQSIKSVRGLGYRWVE
ncbi:winged helix-turn-helix domain-containing protein [Mycoplasma sp. P36-A1]|uniref:winged helix-turn-helix domain-containing protein n=1 Tax=Mycoplasma sp. P36-A1 TaxID=3252900 RepID=UPI003C304EE1